MTYGYKPNFVNGGVYHLYNRGVAKQEIFIDDQDYQRFLLTLAHYLEASPERRLSLVSSKALKTLLAQEPSEPLVEIIAYCLMSNHFHIIVRQIQDDGVSTFMRRALNSYTRSFNTRHNRVGTVFQGVYQAVVIDTDQQLLHISRYTHLNPFVAKLVDVPGQYCWSSYPQFLEVAPNPLCHPQLILDIVGGPSRYQDFVEDYASYARDLVAIKDLLLDLNE